MTDPRDYHVNATLRNGLAVTIRHLRDDDRERIAKAIRGLDRETIYTRLFTYRQLTEAGLDRVMRTDPDSEVALVVTTGAGADEIVIGSGRYVLIGGEGGARTAEVAFTVEEDYQGLGIAGRLLSALAEIARGKGIGAFSAEVLAGNASMRRVFVRSGLPMRERREGGVVHLTLEL